MICAPVIDHRVSKIGIDHLSFNLMSALADALLIANFSLAHSAETRPCDVIFGLNFMGCVNEQSTADVRHLFQVVHYQLQ